MEPTGSDSKTTLKHLLVTCFIAVTMAIADNLVSPGKTPLAVLNQRQAMTKEKLVCAVTGEPKPVITWTKNGNVIRTGSDSIYTATDPGVYRCIASNIYGTSMSDKATVIQPELKLIGNKKNIKDAKEVTLSLGESYVFQIKELVSVPTEATEISWTFEDLFSEIDEDRYLTLDDGSLYISEVRVDEADQKLRCTTYNSETVSSKACGYYKINVESLPFNDAPSCLELTKQYVAMKGDDVTLKCACSGQMTKIKWKSSVPTFEQRYGSILHLRNVSSSDSGNYTCISTNSVGDATSVHQLSVQSIPDVTDQPKHYKVGLHTPQVQFYCKGRGVPNPTAEWYINDKNVHELQSRTNYVMMLEPGVLTIKDLSVTTSMNVHCNLSNPNGYVWLQGSLIVKDQESEVSRSKLLTTITTSSSNNSTTTPKSTTVTTKSTTTSTEKPHVTTNASREMDSNSTNIDKPSKYPLKESPSSSSTVIWDSKDIEIDPDTYIKFNLPLKYILIGTGVVGVVLIIIAIVCTVLCVKCCQNRKEEKTRYPRSNTLSNLSYISQLARIRDFDIESEDSGIDERSVLKSKTSIPRLENQENHKNEYDEMIQMDPNITDQIQPNIMEQHL